MKSIKKLLAIVIAVALIVSCVAINASAVNYYNIVVGEVEVTDANCNNITGDEITGSVKYDDATRTLTLDNATITNSAQTTLVDAQLTPDLTVVVKGTCNLIGINISALGISNVDGDIIIKGDGTLNIDLSTSAYGPGYAYGIFARGTELHNITICDSVTVNVESTGDGIFATKDVIIKDSAKVESNAAQFAVYAAKNLAIDGDVIVEASSGYYAILVDNGGIDINLGKDCYVEASSTYDYAISGYGYEEFNITLAEGAYVHAKAADVGISTNSTITLNDAKITIPEDGYVDGAAFKNKDGYYVDEYKIECYKEYDADDAEWTKGSTEGQSITSEADIDTFAEKVTVDGDEVESTNYTVTEGSTKVTFKPAYLETLSLGEHEVVIYSVYGEATGTLTIKEAVTPVPPTKPDEEPTEPVEEEPTEPVEEEEETTTEPVEEEEDTEPSEEPAEETTKSPKKEAEEVADTSDKTVIGAFVALGTLASAGYISLKKKED